MNTTHDNTSHSRRNGHGQDDSRGSGVGDQPENFSNGTDVMVDESGLLNGVSVQCAPGKSVRELSHTIQNGQVGVTTVGEIRQAGGTVTTAGSTSNPDHCLVSGIDAKTASRLFTPTIRNPNRVR